jgi:hypothetical protein
VNRTENRHFLDGPYARLAALACFLISAGVLAYVHRDDLLGRKAVTKPESAADDAFARCYAAAKTPIDRMLSEKLIKAEEAGLFRQRAEARCRAQTRDAGGPPAPGGPGLPPVR